MTEFCARITLANPISDSRARLSSELFHALRVRIGPSGVNFM